MAKQATKQETRPQMPTFKIKRKAISTGDLVFKKWSQWKQGDIVVGKIIGTHKSDYKGNVTWCPIIEVEYTHFKGDKEEYIGKKMVLNYTVGLRNKLNSIECIAMETDDEIKYQNGKAIQLEFLGKKPTKDGDNEYNDYDIAEVSLGDEDSEEDVEL